jgi:hypothetical protein
MKVFENKMLCRILGPKEEDGEKLYDKELHNLYSSCVG